MRVISLNITRMYCARAGTCSTTPHKTQGGQGRYSVTTGTGVTSHTVPFAHAVFADASSKAAEQATHRDVQQLLNGQHIAVLHAHHGHIVQAVKVGQALQAHTVRQKRTS